MADFFNFEDENIDVPFYNGVAKLSKWEWLLLILAEILFVIPILLPIPMSDLVFSFYLCMVVLIPILYVCKGNLGLFFKKIRRNDFKLIIICVILQYVYSMSMLFIIEYFKIAPQSDVEAIPITLSNIISLIVQLMGEELFKIILLILAMALIYYFSKNRKLSMILSALITMFVFGLVHEGAYGTLLQVLLIQGLGSFLDLYSYLKTKNVLVSYTIHLLFDLIPFAMEILLILLGIPP